MKSLSRFISILLVLAVVFLVSGCSGVISALPEKVESLEVRPGIPKDLLRAVVLEKVDRFENGSEMGYLVPAFASMVRGALVESGVFFPVYLQGDRGAEDVKIRVRARMYEERNNHLVVNMLKGLLHGTTFTVLSAAAPFKADFAANVELDIILPDGSKKTYFARSETQARWTFYTFRKLKLQLDAAIRAREDVMVVLMNQVIQEQPEFLSGGPTISGTK